MWIVKSLMVYIDSLLILIDNASTHPHIGLWILRDRLGLLESSMADRTVHDYPCLVHTLVSHCFAIREGQNGCLWLDVVLESPDSMYTVIFVFLQSLQIQSECVPQWGHSHMPHIWVHLHHSSSRSEWGGYVLCISEKKQSQSCLLRCPGNLWSPSTGSTLLTYSLCTHPIFSAIVHLHSSLYYDL